MIPQNPFQSLAIRPVASPVNSNTAPGTAGGTLSKDLLDLSALSATAAAAAEGLQKMEKQQFKEDFTLGLAEAESNPQLLSNLQVSVEAQKGVPADLRSKLKRLRKDGKLSGPSTTGYYAGVETAIGIQVGKNKGSALNKFVSEHVNQLDPESDTAPTPLTFDQLHTQFEFGYKEPAGLPQGYYAADGFANSYAQDIDSARNGYFKAVTEYEKRRGLNSTLQLGADVTTKDVLDGVKTPEATGMEVMNHVKNAVDLGLIAPEDRRDTIHGIIALAAHRASVSRGDRQAQLGLDVIEAAKEWKIEATGKTLIEDDPAFFEKVQDDWEKRLRNDTQHEGQIITEQSNAMSIKWTSKLNTAIAHAQAEGRSVSHAVEDVRSELLATEGKSPYFGNVDLALVSAGAAASSAYDRTDPEVLRKVQRDLAVNKADTVNLLTQGPYPGLSEKDRVNLVGDASEGNGGGEGGGEGGGFASSLAKSIGAPASFIPISAEAAGSVSLSLSDIMVAANDKHNAIQRQLQAGTIDYASAQSEIAKIKQEALKESDALVAPLKAEYTRNYDIFHKAESAGDLTTGIPALDSLLRAGLISHDDYSQKSARLRDTAAFNPVFRTSDWQGFDKLIDQAMIGGEKDNLLKVAAANERLAEEMGLMKTQSLAWRKEGYSMDEITSTLMVPYLSERRAALLKETLNEGHDAEALDAELKAGGTVQTYAKKTGESQALEAKTTQVLLKPLIDKTPVDVGAVQKELFSPSFSGNELPDILNSVYNGGSLFMPAGNDRMYGLTRAVELANDIADGTAYANAADKSQMIVDLLGLVPGGLHYTDLLEGNIPVHDVAAYRRNINIKGQSTYEFGVSPLGNQMLGGHAEDRFGTKGAGEPLARIALAEVVVNPYRHSLFNTKAEIVEANESGKLKGIMSILGLPLTDAAAKAFVDAQTNLLTLGY